MTELHADWLLISAPKRSKNDKTRESHRHACTVMENHSVILLFSYVLLYTVKRAWGKMRTLFRSVLHCFKFYPLLDE